MAAFGGNESCPNCGAQMAADQRYCLNCGHRRGDPRLPFMDAVVFMESMNGPAGRAAPPPPPPPAEPRPSSRMNANAALIAGVATLVLAIGVGFLIGRSGHEQLAPGRRRRRRSSRSAAAARRRRRSRNRRDRRSVDRQGRRKDNGRKSKGGTKAAEEAKPAPKRPRKPKENSQVGEHGASKATEEALHTEGGVKLRRTGRESRRRMRRRHRRLRESGKFEGNFFGE